jgi:hypothetical protein
MQIQKCKYKNKNKSLERLLGIATRMDSVVRNIVEPYFENILRRITELDKKINLIDSRLGKIESDVLVIGCKINNAVLELQSRDACKMEEVD